MKKTYIILILLLFGITSVFALGPYHKDKTINTLVCRADFDRDLDVDTADWPFLRDNFMTKSRYWPSLRDNFMTKSRDGDVDMNGIVNFRDFYLFRLGFGKDIESMCRQIMCNSDVNDDGIVDGTDWTFIRDRKPEGDVDGNGVINTRDFKLFAHWVGYEVDC